MEVRKRGLRLGKREFTDVAWMGELMRDHKALKFRSTRIQNKIMKWKRNLNQLEVNFNAEKKSFVDAINDMESTLDIVFLAIEKHQKSIDKLNPKRKAKAKPKPAPIPEKTPEAKPKSKLEKVAESIKESLEETIEEITDEIVEHQEKTIRAVKSAVNGEFAQTIIEGKILCPECIAQGKKKEESLFTKGGAFIAHYRSHFKNGNGDGGV